jgi:predicted permease
VFISKLKRRWRALIHRDELEYELDEELRFHVERDAAQNLEKGMSPEDARYHALRNFGGVDQSKEECRDARGVRLIETFVQDLRYTLRMFIKSPAFTLVAVLTLTLGIGANTAIFSLLDAVLLKSLAVKEPDKLVLFGKGESQGVTNSFPNESWDLFSYPFYQEVRKHNEVFTDVTALLSIPWDVHGRVNTNAASDDAEQINVQLVSGTYFSVLGVNAISGRAFNEADDQIAGGHPVAVASYAWWQRRMGGNQAIVGKSITIDQTNYTIIGVAPKEFFGTTVGQAPDIWVPLAMGGQLPPAHWNGREDKSFQPLYLIGRLKEGVSAEQAKAVVNLLFKQSLQELAGAQPAAEKLRDIQQATIELTPAGKGLSELRREFSLSLRILMVVVGVVLLIACANVANLLLARAAARQKEFALRLALGAGRMRLIRQLLTESVLLAGLGGLGGIVLAWWGSRLLVLMASDGPRSLPLDVTPNARILGFTFIASLLSSVVFGIAPALRATRLDLNTALKEGKGAVRANSQGPLGKALVVAQVALSLLLMVLAGLFVRTLVNLQSIPTGFNQQNVMLFKIDTATTGYKDEQYAPLLRDAEERVKTVPGVQAASFSFFIFHQGGWTSSVSTREQTPPEGENKVVRQNVVGPDYFMTMGIPLVLGRGFGPQDTANSQKVAIVSEAMAQRFFPNSSPLGRRFGVDGPESRDQIEIVGVVKDAKYGSLTERLRPMAYYPHSQRSQSLDNFVVRFSGDPTTLVPQVRQAIREVNRNLPIDEVLSVSEHIDRSLVQQKLIARLASFFGVLALLLACVGLYGILSYSVARRTGEIGIRMALGASTTEVLKNGMTLALVGVALGICGAFALTRLVASLLFGVKPTDLVTFAAVSATLIVVAFSACYLPARRATKVDPLKALRYE